MPNLIALAIPFFFLLIGVELWMARRRGVSVYRFPDALANLSCGMTQQILLVFEVAALTGGYVWLYQHRIFSFREGSVWPWVIAFFAVLFTGKFPRSLRDFVVGVMRWGNRVTAYVLFLTDEYPPFRLS